MPDPYGTFGILPLPAPAPEVGAALTDPALDIVADFIKSVINYDLGAAWASRAPTDPLPIRYVFNHAPNLESFNMDEVPALYAWRADDNGRFRYSQDMMADDAGMHFLWVPPALAQEDERFIQAFRNGIKKSLQSAFGQGRHPGWVRPGDDYYDPEAYGSVLLYHTKMAIAQLGFFRQQPLVVESADKSFRKTFDTYLFHVNTLEFFSFDLSRVDALQSFNGTTVLARPAARADELLVASYVADPTLVSVDVNHGPAGTAVAISGKQLDVDGPNDLVVSFGTAAELAAGTAAAVDPDLLFPVDESTVNVAAPAHVAGLVSIRVAFPDGVVKTLDDAFTYT